MELKKEKPWQLFKDLRCVEMSRCSSSKELERSLAIHKKEDKKEAKESAEGFPCWKRMNCHC